MCISIIARFRHLPKVRAAERENGYLNLDQDTLDQLIGKNVKYFDLLNKIDLKPSQQAILYSIFNSNIESLLRLFNEYAFKCPRGYPASLEIYEVLFEKYGYIPSIDHANSSFYRRDLKSLKFMYEKFNILPTSENLFERHNDVQILNWLYDKMIIPIGQHIVDIYAPTASIELLKFYYDKYHLLPSNDVLGIMKKQANFAGLNWRLKQCSI